MARTKITEEPTNPRPWLKDENGNAIRDGNNKTIQTSGDRKQRREVYNRKSR
jgi:hypothetical protein